MTAFQILSDVHTEFYPEYDSGFPDDFPLIKQVEAPFLILAGDIGAVREGAIHNYRAFLTDVAARFLRVFLVMGNHEAYGTSVEVARNTLASLCHDINREAGWSDRVVFLDRTRYDLHHPVASGNVITVLGCPLWSHITPEQRAFVVNKCNDFHLIGGAWSPERHNATHAEDVAWLQRSIKAVAEEAPGRTVVVVTHHAPLTEGVQHPQFEDSLISSAFQTNLRAVIGAPVRLWVFGHTHYSSHQTINGVHVVSYQQGYEEEATETGFDPDVQCVINLGA